MTQAINTDTDTILEALNEKMDRDFQNADTTYFTDAIIDYQRPTSQNNYTWYRLYRSGWIEQGGKATSTTITLIKEMADGNYSVSMTQISGSAYAAEPQNLTTTGFTYYQYQSIYNAYWEVKGFAAQS